MPFTFQWENEERTLIRYIATGDWNWKDYHTVVRISLFSIPKTVTLVDSIIDFTGSTRPALPAGLLGHVRTFGKKHHASLSGRAIVIGLPKSGEAQLNAQDSRQFITPDGMVQFVDSEDDILDVLSTWQTERG